MARILAFAQKKNIPVCDLISREAVFAAIQTPEPSASNKVFSEFICVNPDVLNFYVSHEGGTLSLPLKKTDPPLWSTSNVARTLTNTLAVDIQGQARPSPLPQSGDGPDSCYAGTARAMRASRTVRCDVDGFGEGTVGFA